MFGRWKLKKLRENYKKGIERKLINKINDYLREGNYLFAGITAQKSQSKELRKLGNKYYNIGANVFPSQRCYDDILGKAEYLLHEETADSACSLKYDAIPIRFDSN